MKIRTLITTGAAALCIVGLTACTGDSKTGAKTGDKKGGDKASETAKEEPKKGGDSPEDVFNKAKALYEADSLDTQAFAELWSPPFRKMASAQMVLMAGFVIDKDKAEPAKKALDELCKKHGIKKPEGKVNFGEAEKHIGPMMADVSDTVACWKDIMDWLVEYSKEVGNKMKNDKPVGDLKDVKTEGDFAMGMGKRLRKGKETEQKMYFRKVDGRWYLDDSPDAKKAFRKPEKKTG